MDQLSINRRKALALLGTSGLSVTALGGVPSPPPDGVTAAPHHCLTTMAMKADRTLKNGMYVQTSGYFHPGDGGGDLGVDVIKVGFGLHSGAPDHIVCLHIVGFFIQEI